MTYKQRLLIFFFIDLFIIFFSVFGAFMLRFEGRIPNLFWLSIPYSFIIIGSLTYVLLYHFKIYKRVWQYASVGEMIAIVKATSLAIVSSFLMYYLLTWLGVGIVIPRSIFLISWMMIVLGIGGSRFIWRILRDKYIKIQPYHKRVLIIGAGQAGARIARELKHSPSTEYYPVAFIDDSPSKLYLEVVGLPVVGTRKDIPSVVKRYNIDTIIIALPSAEKREIAEVIDICKTTRAHIKMLPRISDFVNGRLSVKMIRDIRPEDLLGRDPVQLDLNLIKDYLKNRTVLVTGAGGSIGSELCRQICSFEPGKLVMIENGENALYSIELELKSAFPNIELYPLIADVKDYGRMEAIFDQYRPDIVFHAAAYKHVPIMEANPVQAILNNVFGTKNIAECADRFNVSQFVLISTDKAVNPTSVMGATKRISELIIQSLDKESKTRFVAVRFGNVLGSQGSVVPLFQKQIENGGPVTITHPDMVRYFMTITEAVQLVIQAGALAKGGEIFILSMGKPIKIKDLAYDMIRMSGLEPGKDIQIVYTGIRPGEKLFEELLNANSGASSTRHESIFVEKPLDVNRDELEQKLRKLYIAVNKSGLGESEAELKRKMKDIVGTYQYRLYSDEQNDSDSSTIHEQRLLTKKV